MLIEFLKEHGAYRIGQVVTHPHAGVADTLVARGIARPVSVPTADTVDRPATTAAAGKPKRVSRK